MYEQTHRLLLQTFFGAADVDNVCEIKANREPLLQALRARGLYQVSTLQMANETFTLLQKDSCDTKLYRYLRSIEVQQPIDLINLTETSKRVIISHVNNHKVKELVTANLNLLLLNNMGAAIDSSFSFLPSTHLLLWLGIRQLLNENRRANGGKLNAEFLARGYHHLMFPLVKTVCGHADVGVHQDRQGLYVCELNELSFKAGIALYDRVLLVNDRPVKTPKEFNIVVSQSNRNSDSRHQVNIVVARVSDHHSATSDELVHELHLTVDTATKVSKYYSRRLSSVNVLLHMTERELLKVFNIIDGDGDGSIETMELQLFLEDSGLGGTRTARKIFDVADVDDDGCVTAAEFLSVMKLIQRCDKINKSESLLLYNTVSDIDGDVAAEGKLEEGRETETSKSVIMEEIDRYISELRQLAQWSELQRK